MSDDKEIDRLAEDCKEQAKKCALELRAMGYMPGVTERLEWGRAFLRYEEAIDRLANLARTPSGTGEVGDAARYRWVADRFLGADFEWGEPSRQVLLIAFDGGPVWGDFGMTVDAAMACSAPSTPIQEGE